MEWTQRVRDRAANFLFLAIKNELGLDMLDIRLSDPFGLPGSVRAGKRPTGRRSCETGGWSLRFAVRAANPRSRPAARGWLNLSMIDSKRPHRLTGNRG